MGIAGGPNLNQDGLVFLYDVFDQDNSYKGEPATNYHDYDKSVMNQTGFNNWSCYDGNPPYHTWGINQSRTFVTIPGPDGKDTPAMLYYNFNGGFYGPTDWGGIPAAICTTGNKITIQAWVKAADAASVGLVVSPYTYFNLNNGGVEATATNWTLTENWQLISHTHTMGSSGTNNNATLYFFTSNGSSPVRMYLTKTAILSGKEHAVQWLPGGTTRSSTQGLLDVAGTSQINISNASFDVNAQMYFDGTNDSIETPFETILNDCSIELWFKATSTGIYQYPLAIRNNSAGSTYSFYLDMNDPDGSGFAQTIWTYWNSGGSPYSVVPKTGTYGDWNDSTWRHYVFTRSTSSSPYTLHYMNGSLVSTINRSGDQTTQFGNGAGYKLYLGQYGANNNYFTGNIPSVKIYNRVLSAQEVLQNYNATKSRFSLK